VMARLPHGDAWYWLILNYFLLLMAIVVVLVLVFFSFAAVGSLLASPFNDVLSEKTEHLLGGRGMDEPFAIVGEVIRICFLRSRRSPGNSPQTPSQIYSFDVQKGR